MHTLGMTFSSSNSYNLGIIILSISSVIVWPNIFPRLIMNPTLLDNVFINCLTLQTMPLWHAIVVV